MLMLFLLLLLVRASSGASTPTVVGVHHCVQGREEGGGQHGRVSHGGGGGDRVQRQTAGHGGHGEGMVADHAVPVAGPPPPWPLGKYDSIMVIIASNEIVNDPATSAAVVDAVAAKASAMGTPVDDDAEILLDG